MWIFDKFLHFVDWFIHLFFLRKKKDEGKGGVTPPPSPPGPPNPGSGIDAPIDSP